MKGKVDASSLKNMVLHSYIVCGVQWSISQKVVSLRLIVSVIVSVISKLLIG